MELIPLAKKQTQDGEEQEELSSGDSLKLDLYFWLQALVLALVALILLFTFVGRIIGVDGSSMYPTLHHGDMLLLQSVGYEPKQGDVVVLTKAFRDVDGPIVKRVIAVGGAQAIAALTFGAGFIPKVDKLVGPGNAFVATAKRLAYGKVDIDMVAGPSEVLVIADETANPVYVAADLLSQAEHDRLASAVLLTTSMELAQAVDAEIIRQTGYLSRSDIMEASLWDFGCAIVCDSLEQAISLANEIAPEHLEIVTEDPRAVLPEIRNAGAVFLGEWSPEPLGDYLAGPNHVLPTSGTARFFSPLSVDSFLKTMSIVAYSRDALAPIREQVVAMAEAEHLTAHANSIRVRFE